MGTTRISQFVQSPDPSSPRAMGLGTRLREEALRDRLVCRIQSEAIQKRLLAEADLTLQKAYEVAQGIEAASKQASELRASSRTQEVHSIASGDTKPCYR